MPPYPGQTSTYLNSHIRDYINSFNTSEEAQKCIKPIENNHRNMYVILKQFDDGVCIFENITFVNELLSLTQIESSDLDTYNKSLRIGRVFISDIVSSTPPLTLLPNQNQFHIVGGIDFSLNLSMSTTENYTMEKLGNRAISSQQKISMLKSFMFGGDIIVYVNNQDIEKISNDIIIDIGSMSGSYHHRSPNKLDELIIAIRSVSEADIASRFTYQTNPFVPYSTRKPNNGSNKYRSINRKGLYVNHLVPFSFEIECYGKDKNSISDIANEMPKDFGISRDGSLTSKIGEPIEIQTCILQGKKGEVALADLLCKKLVEKKFKVDKTCGLHLHLDGGDIVNKNRKIFQSDNERRPDELISFYLFHRLFEDVIVSFLPSTRRLNKYCAQFKDGVEYQGDSLSYEIVPTAFRQMKNIKSLKDFILYTYKTDKYERVIMYQSNRYVIHRYMGINIHSLLKDNHVEIRYHSGTLNYEKMLYWADLHGNILKECSEGRITEEILSNILKQHLSLEEKTKRMFSMLDLNSDTIDYLMDRQNKFKDIEYSEEILIDKTKKVSIE